MVCQLARTFGHQICSSLCDTCHGNINMDSGVVDTMLASMDDAELLVRSTSLTGAQLAASLSGFDTSVGSTGMLSYLSRQRDLATASMHRGTPDPDLQLGTTVGWQPQQQGTGLRQWLANGGWLVGTDAGNGTADEESVFNVQCAYWVRAQRAVYVAAMLSTSRPHPVCTLPCHPRIAPDWGNTWGVTDDVAGDISGGASFGVFYRSSLWSRSTTSYLTPAGTETTEVTA